MAIGWPSLGTAVMTKQSDHALVKKSKAGDTEAFSELVLRHEKSVYGLAFQFMRETTAAEDMTQEAFLKAYRLLRGFRGDCSFSTWLYRVTCSVCLTELKRQGRRNEVTLEPGHLAEQPVQESEPPETRDLRARIRQCVTLLPDRYATIIALYYLEGSSYEEIASAMEIPLGTLKTWMYRARQELRTIVERELDDHALQ